MAVGGARSRGLAGVRAAAPVSQTWELYYPEAGATGTEIAPAAQTPWATPLIYPQAVWYVGLVIFSLVATGYALRATMLLFTGRTADVLHEFQPKSAKEELREELDDLAHRHAGDGAKS